MIEVSASLVVLWHLRHPDRSTDRVTARALRLVGAAFFALAASLALATVWAVSVGHVPEESPLGIGYLALTVLVMLSLAVVKGRLGRRLRSRPLIAESRLSLLDSVLAASVLSGLVLNAALGWWWADVLAALLVAGAALIEGVENWTEASELADPVS
jgi:divalent metal cation (Fe/Co/Zn/Cd) transporter